MRCGQWNRTRSSQIHRNGEEDIGKQLRVVQAWIEGCWTSWGRLFDRSLWCGRLARKMHSCIGKPPAARPGGEGFPSGTRGVVPFVALFGGVPFQRRESVDADQCNGWLRRTRHGRSSIGAVAEAETSSTGTGTGTVANEGQGNSCQPNHATHASDSRVRTKAMTARLRSSAFRIQ